MKDQITLMLEESNKRMSMIMTGNFKPEMMNAAQSEFRGQIKLVNTVVSAIAIAAKNDRAIKALKSKKLIDLDNLFKRSV
jgi:hypothetical protein